MAMLRLNVPSVFLYGGSILPGKYKGKEVTVQDVFEAVGKYDSEKITENELCELERVACPSAGSCEDTLKILWLVLLKQFLTCAPVFLQLLLLTSQEIVTHSIQVSQ